MLYPPHAPAPSKPICLSSPQQPISKTPTISPQAQAAMTRSADHTGTTHPRSSPSHKTSSITRPTPRLCTLYGPVPGSSGQSAASLHPAPPHMTCAPGCSGNSSWRRPRSADGTIVVGRPRLIDPLDARWCCRCRCRRSQRQSRKSLGGRSFGLSG
jgi:hypothetical protein